MVKYAFVEVLNKEEIVLPDSFISKLPKSIALFTTIQYIHQINGFKKQIELSGRSVTLIKTRHTRHDGQILGCNIDKYQDVKVDGYVYVGDGEFHPKALMYRNEKDVFVFNPHNKQEQLITTDEINKLRKKYTASIGQFYMEQNKNIGVLVVTKPGQNQFLIAERLSLKFPDKNFYLLLSNTIDFNSLEDFSFIDMFVNTACPRIAYDDTSRISKPVVNIGDIFKTNLGWQQK